MKTIARHTDDRQRLCREQGRGGVSPRHAFTLLELLVVLGIIGLLATLAMPTLRNFGESNTISAANRQLLDDIGLARQLALNTRSSVYMVFVPPNHYQHRARLPQVITSPEFKRWSNLMTGRYTAYALMSMRTIGDQPGREHPRYLTDWRYLPEGVYIHTNKFNQIGAVNDRSIPLQSLLINNIQARTFKWRLFPYPTARSPVYYLPYIGFTPDGRLIPESNGAIFDEVIPLVRGSIFTEKNVNGQYVDAPPDIQEIPPGNSTNNYNLIHVNAMTARARIVRPELK